MDEYVDSLAAAKIFCTLDANCGFCKVEVHKMDREKTKFISHHGLYRFTRMLFRLRNVPALFQRILKVILSTLKRQYALVYSGDIVIFARPPDEHNKHTEIVLRLLKIAGATL